MCDFYAFEQGIAEDPVFNLRTNGIFDDTPICHGESIPSGCLTEGLKNLLRTFIRDAVENARVFLNNGEVYILFRAAYSDSGDPIYRLYNTKDKNLHKIFTRGYRVHASETNPNEREDSAANIKGIVNSTIDAIESYASFHLQETPFHIRISHLRGAALYDLNNQLNSVLKITAK